MIRLRSLVGMSIINVRKHQETYNQMQSRFSHGAAVRSEVTLARARLASSRARLFAFQGQLKNINYSLERLVGKKVKVYGKQKVPNKLLPKKLSRALSLAYQNNPSLILIRKQLKAAHEKVLEQKSRFWFPDVSLQMFGSINKDYSTLRGTTKDLQGSVVVDYTFFLKVVIIVLNTKMPLNLSLLLKKI